MKKIYFFLLVMAGMFCLPSCGGDDNDGPDPDKFVNEVVEANGVEIEMIAVKGGTFTMGATSEQGSDARGWEKPAHKVTLSD
ncbi:MAG: hypothetical protein IKX94_04080, partial [Muribaculaceae bacterium]|nr:hypothetical protein [Muribaculaceae bacterium]